MHGCRICNLDTCERCFAVQTSTENKSPEPAEESVSQHETQPLYLQAAQNHRLDGLSREEKRVIQEEVLNHHSHSSSVHETQTQIIDAIFNNRFTLRDCFANFDTDDSGTVTIEEFRQGLSRLGVTTSAADITALLQVADINHDGEFQFNEFVEKLRPTRMECDAKHQHEALEGGTPQAIADEVLAMLFELHEDNVWQTFKEFDCDGNGWISKKEMKELIKTVVGPMGMAARDFDALWRSLDENGDGRINWIEWLETMKVVRQDIEDKKRYE
jgi:Ca2+-binding EF-hand superfamily protein